MDDVLYHHGVKGMKWGHRKQKSKGNKQRKRINSTKIVNNAKKVGKVALTVGAVAGAAYLNANADRIVSSGMKTAKLILKNSGSTNYSSIKNKTKVISGYLRNKRIGMVYL